MSRYNTISNTPVDREHVMFNHCTWDDAYTTEEIDKISNYCSSLTIQPGEIFGDDQETLNNSIRKSDIAFVHYDNKNEDTRWFFHKTNNLIRSMNDMFYQFDLNGYDYFQYGEYDGNKKSKYDYHFDIAYGTSNDPMRYVIGHRKLSFVLCLSDSSEYEGGKFLIDLGSKGLKKPIEVEQKKGRMIAFPSFVLHKVSEVTSGKRKSIAIWTTGPKFK
jgi:PKHD-type hydroxylase